ncbi:TetR/AcrR family transcriptional regulator [Variovorax ginsengisoli]|uniref:TetR/AcrR family transcriptional regulator n=1 Tax=Variovorax ginsengisoli TaxID=363844 RepID=A0ABT8SDB7_9BURK|nr:TetR/AcrR family transcriptional regulator [Variovorax ginsengisoli]MDN8617658.1 TetR/AcrR family transcriptional regulator [Variovorax ginsengisoli]MDO1536828.1 TetR/AcrR family transcriptional regulator [Variovorax ginsengisoli]
MYRPPSSRGFGKKAPAAAPSSKPLKRPTQARGKFTVQAIYDAFVRIWEAEGWDGVTTRAVALETGIAVGTLYDYFPDKEALLSGYVRHCVEALLARLDADVVAPPAAALAARERIARLVRITCDSRLDGLPAFDHGMLLLEHRVAEPKHHLRVYDELATRWLQAFAACGLPDPPTDATVHALLTAAWGGRRYRLLRGLGSGTPDDAAWVAEMDEIAWRSVAAQRS